MPKFFLSNTSKVLSTFLCLITVGPIQMTLVVITIFAFQLSMDLGLSFLMNMFFFRGEPLAKFFRNAYFGFLFPMRGLAGAERSSFPRYLHLKFSILFHRHLEISQLLDDVRNVILSVCGVDKQWHAYITTFLRCFVFYCLL